MSRKKWPLLAVGAISAIAVVAFFAVPTLLGFSEEGPPQLAIGDRSESSIAAVLGREDGAQPADPDSASTAEGLEVVDPVQSETIRIETADGDWILTGDSVAGYRVFKEFVGLSDFEAVGRTSSITGELSIEDNGVTDAEFRVNIASITSDDPRRDAQFRGPILQAEIFPFATFTLTSRIELDDAALAGESVTVDATGELTLKGVTNEVEIPLTARLVGDEVQVSGSIDVIFDDFDIDPPFTPTIVVDDIGVIEFSLFFEQADSV